MLGPAPVKHTLLLRSPPFPALDSHAFARPLAPTPSEGLPADIFARIRAARVGGTFWAESFVPSQPGATIDRADTTQTREVDPWSTLATASHLEAHGDDEWVALARIAGVAVTVLSPGRFGAPGDDDAALDRHTLDHLARQRFANPFTGEPVEILDAIELLAEWRRALDGNRGSGPHDRIVVASGMAWWKRKEIRQFLWLPEGPLKIVSSPRRALRVAQRSGGSLAVWPSRVSPALIAEAGKRGVGLVRVEDGFVRSAGLGSNLVPPSSIVVDRLGIHFDPGAHSDLEAVLATHPFPPSLATRARALRETIVEAGISKYATGHEATPDHLPKHREGSQRARRIVLVPGQVEDDMSVRAGGGGIASNLELLRRARALEPDAEIWWRPHPDVDAGHRIGAIPDAQAHEFADRIVRGGGMAPLLDAVDAVHVLTSLTGFEALMRGREVICHGTPFYAGWGLTRDLGEVPDRRGRRLSLDELVAGVLILYPRYLDPVTGLPCPPEVLVARMAENAAHNRQSWIAPLRHWQGRLMARIRAALHRDKETTNP